MSAVEREVGRRDGVAFVYNPAKVDLPALERAVEAARGDLEVSWHPTSAEDSGTSAAQAALESGARVVIAAGGDGTVRAVAEVVCGSRAALGLLPSGTGNLLARNLDLTLSDLPGSVVVALHGRERSVDVAQIEIRRADDSIDEHLFLVMAGTGLDAKIMSSVNPELKKRVGWLAYAHAFFTVLRDKSVLRLQYRVDDHRTRSEPALALIVGNCGSLPANILLLPDAVIDDGLLDVVILKPETLRGWVEMTFKILWENGIVRRTALGRRLHETRTRSLDMWQGREVTVRLNRSQTVELDGDPMGEMIGCRIRVLPEALTVKVPER